jgi:predicted CoA-substrate-specific enzyme activase
MMIEMKWFMGLDIGSTASKGAITGNGHAPVYHHLPSRADYGAAAEALSAGLLAKTGLRRQDIAATVITGHNAGDLPAKHQRVADIRCCARGIARLFPQARTVVDVQAMSGRVIRLSPEGRVTEFISSELCAAGGGRFLEVMANILRVKLDDIGPLSLKSRHPVHFTTGCAVFAESEAISRVAEGAAKEDILAGVHRALAEKLAALVERAGMEEGCALCGGGALDSGLIRALQERLGVNLLVPERPQFVTALGAAIMAGETGRNEEKEQP